MAGRRWKLPKEPTAREREMEEALTQARERGETHAAVAGRLGITVETVKWWSWRIGTRRRAQRRPRATTKRQGRVDRASHAVPSFVEVCVDQRRPLVFEVVLGGERAVRVPSGFDATELGRLLHVLEAAC